MAERERTQRAHNEDMMRDGADRPTGAGMDPSGEVGAFRLVAIAAGPLVALAVISMSSPPAMPPSAWAMLALTLWMVIWWLTEAVPIPATALVPLFAYPLFGLGTVDDVAPSYADPIIYLFLGGFLLAAAMQKSGLHRRIALRIVAAVGTSPRRIILGFMLATAFLSMWISNTATTVMMFAVGVSVVNFVTTHTDDDHAIHNFGVALLLAIAYAASIGGVGTLIGTPPNAFLASFLSDNYDVEISFFTWMLFGVPVVVVMLPIAWILLVRFLFPAGSLKIEGGGDVIREELDSLGPMSREEIFVGIVFLATALCWIFRTPIASATGLEIDDTVIAMAAAAVLFAVPVRPAEGVFALDWASARDIPWGVLVLFGGGLALASGFNDSGLAEFIGEAVGGFQIALWLLVLVVLVAIVYLTEITSNTASTATFLPILGAVAVGLSVDPLYLVVPVAVGASMAFMMPVATPPNAIVFSYERMSLTDMVRAGFALNIIAIVVGYGLFMTLGVAVLGVGDGGGGGGGQ